MHDQYKQVQTLKRDVIQVDAGEIKPGKFNYPHEYFEPLIQQYKKMAAGPSFWLINDLAKEIILSAGGMLEKMTSIRLLDMMNCKPDILFTNYHPEDLNHFLVFTQYWISFFTGLTPDRKTHVRPTIYVRMKNPAQQYAWVMIQYVDYIFDQQGRIAYGLTIVTDISHMKKDGVAMMSIMDQHQISCRHYVCSGNKIIPVESQQLPRISAREIDVLRFLAFGHSSKQIAYELNVAVKTVDNHRQNLLKKTNRKSSGELVAYAINNGYL